MYIKINGEKYAHFNGFSLSSSLDSVASSFAFSLRFDPNDNFHKRILKPLAYHKVEFYNDKNQLFFTGRIITHKFNSKAVRELVVVSGYSLPGVLEDCSIPYSLYPLESLESNLREITQKIIQPFGIQLVVDGSAAKEAGINYEKSVAEPSQSCKDYISKLASQRNILLSHDIHGRLVLLKPNINAKARKRFEKANGVEISLDVDGQALHSELTILSQTSTSDVDSEDAGLTPEDTIKNPLVNIFRPNVQTMSSGEEEGTKPAVENYLGEELRSIKVNIDLEFWEDMFVGDIIEVKDPECYLYDWTRLIVESTTINEDSGSRSMSIAAVLPQCYAIGTPKKIFG